MLARNDLDRIQIACDDHRVAANAGLILPVTLAHHLGWTLRIFGPNERGRLRVGDKGSRKFLNVWGKYRQ